ncbi:MAG TPA: YbjQ family protein [Candidatus Hydrogenedentes bacterium]|nr:YbjQ family protein [Candidatus Hydrogenedentota bacterium]HOJ68873.1 YbjQ family protein [Candidatus Hydrogenedentota bacterium]HOK89063.1 YbjQ family protein [Candidatus Hydrogenedentota bacterium]HOV59902.1 YbjQ family protein [Candidatus Hydrogenedentota bacterium]HPO29968.1 YbjQ family protein [Candidatus Hydrogenedentota bacterium]
MILTNIDNVPNMRVVEHYGLVSGSTVRAKHIGKDIMAGLKNIVGGELKGYTELLTEARKDAMERMIAQARALGANAVINVRFATSAVAPGAAELYVYGTAVRVEAE